MTDERTVAMLRQVLGQLERIEALPPAELARLQEKLRATLDHCARAIARIEAELLADPVSGRCGRWMPNAGEYCARGAGHRWGHRTREAMDTEAAFRRSGRVA